MSDDELVRRARQGDAAAFGELVDRHRLAVYRAARAALHDHADAEDAAQDAFVAAYRRLDSFRGDASFKTWLLTIAWHQAINRRRSLSSVWKRIAQPLPDHDPSVAEVAALGPSPEQAVAGDQLRRVIANAIRELPVKLRDTLLLTQSGEYTYEQVAAIVGAPLGTIKWRVAEARKAIRKKLREQGYGEPT